MKIISLIFSCVMCSHIIAQTPDAASELAKPSRLKLGIGFSPNFAFRTLIDNEESTTTNGIIENRNEIETAKIGYHCGISVGYQLSKKWQLQSGLLYNRRGYSALLTNLVYGDIIDPRKGFLSATGSAPHSIRFNYSFNYLDLPISIHYTAMQKGNFKLLAGLGASAGFMLNASRQSVYYYTSDKTRRTRSKDATDYNLFNASALVLVGAEYTVSAKWSARVEPNFNYTLTSLIDAPIDARLWSAGINFRCIYNL
jgi:Outer membrane protein beta-barrel domain